MNHTSEVDIPSDANHQDICKFETPEDPRFIKLQHRIAEKINVIVKVAKAELEARKRREEEAQKKREEEEAQAREDPRVKDLPTIPSGILGHSDTCS